MVDKETARFTVERHIRSLRTDPPMDLVILDDRTIEADFGWVFFWNSREYIETGDFRHALAGNVPLIVDRSDGSLHETTTGESLEHIIDHYRKSRMPNS